jgi:hypothetical protein
MRHRTGGRLTIRTFDFFVTLPVTRSPVWLSPERFESMIAA